MKRLLLSLTAAVALTLGYAEDPAQDLTSGIDCQTPDYIRVSLLIASPGVDAFSCVGHSAIRLECPSLKHDDCFTYENEQAISRLPSFFAGKLRMGMFSVPTKEFLDQYRAQGRGVWQYELKLPVEVEQRLWKHLKELVAAGSVPLKEHIECGCAKSMLDCIVYACEPKKLTGPQITITQREVFSRELKGTHPWSLFGLHAIVGTEADSSIEAVTPQSLLDHLRLARLEGRNVLVSKGAMLLPQKLWFKSSWFTPMVFAILLFVLTLVAVGFRWCPFAYAMMSLQFLAGLFFVYLVIFAQLPVSGWNWLLVPFNPIVPVLVFWKKSRPVFLGYALALIAWIVTFALLPHAKTDPAYLVIAGAFAVIYGDLWLRAFRARKIAK